MSHHLYNLACGGAYVFLILLIGYVLLCWSLKPGIRHWAELAGLCFAAGFGTLSFVLFVISIAGIKPSRPELILIAIVALALLIDLGRRNRILRFSVPLPRRRADVLTPLGILGIVLIVAAIGNVAARANWPGLNETDVFAIWLFKAKWVAYSALRPIPAAFLDPTLSYSHQDYPLSLPFIAAGLYALIGNVDDTTTKMLCLPIYLALVAVIYGAVRRMHRRAIALCITATFAAAPTLCQNAGLVVAETPLLLAFAGMFMLFLRWIELGEAGDLTLAGLFAAIAAFTKNEGLGLLPLVAGISLLLAIIRGRWKDWCLAAMVCALAIGPWVVYRTFLPKTHEDYGGKFSHPSVAAHNLDRLNYILPGYFGRLLDGPRVGLVWYVLIVATFLGMRAFRHVSVRVLWCVMLIQLLLYLATFIVTPWDITVLLPMITPKLLTQASVIAVLLIALHLRELQWAGSDKLPL